MLDALPLADQPRAGDRAVASARMRRFARSPPSSSSPSALQPPDRLRLQPAIGQFLDAVGQPALEVAAVERRRLAVEQVAPLLPSARASAWSSARPGARGWDRVGHAFLLCVAELHDRSGRAGSVANFLRVRQIVHLTAGRGAG